MGNINHHMIIEYSDKPGLFGVFESDLDDDEVKDRLRADAEEGYRIVYIRRTGYTTWFTLGKYEPWSQSYHPLGRWLRWAVLA